MCQSPFFLMEYLYVPKSTHQFLSLTYTSINYRSRLNAQLLIKPQSTLTVT